MPRPFGLLAGAKLVLYYLNKGKFLIFLMLWCSEILFKRVGDA